MEQITGIVEQEVGNEKRKITAKSMKKHKRENYLSISYFLFVFPVFYVPFL